MRYTYIHIILFSALLYSSITTSQVGIGTITPDPSSILELYSTDKGFLMPRLTNAERDLIPNPATGLMIYNLSSGSVEVNTGTPATPVWTGTTGNSDSTILSVISNVDITTSSTTSVLISGMTLTPSAGTYLVLFNGQFSLNAADPVSTAQGVIDLQEAYDTLMAFVATNTTHPAVFGNGETLIPGVYQVAAAISLAGILTLDGGGDTNSVFIIRTGGAYSTGASTTVVLTNGALARNVFWVSEGALSLAANTVMKGILMAHAGAVSAAAGTDLEGKMFSLAGAISFGPGTAYIPSGASAIELGVLSTFVMFTSSGAVSNTEPSTITGDVGTNLGAVTGFENLNGNIYSPGSAPPPATNTLVTFAVFKNNLIVASSSRTIDVNTSVISLQAMASVTTGQSIDIRWYVNEGEAMLGNRIMTLIAAN